jgi:hypothetical protein
VVLDRVHRQSDDLHVAPVELGFDLGEVAEFRRADGGEVARVGEQHGPRVADPVVEPQGPLRRLGLEVGGQLVDLQCHFSSFFLGWW